MSFYRMRHWWDSFSRMPSNIWWVGATCDIIPLLQVSHRFRHISGNIKWTPVQWNWCLCLHRKYTFNGWRSNLYSLTIVILLSWLLFSFRGRGEGFNARASAWASFNLKAEVFFLRSLIQYCLRCAVTEHLKSYIIKMMNTSVRACWLSGSRLTTLSYLCVCNWKLSLNSKRNKDNN